MPTMNFGFFHNLPRWFLFHSNMESEPTKPKSITTSISLADPPKHLSSNIKLWGQSLFLIVPWFISQKDRIRTPFESKPNTNFVSNESRGCSLPLFRPYVAKVPWHKGPRGFLSQLFPRYGHYCGPNWSSGKDTGSMLWDRRPIDWLDFCCYCHDIGYDTHDQAKLLKADLAFLECLEKPRMSNKGDAHVAYLYRSMCITGLRNVLIPYRMQLVRLQTGQTLVDWLGKLNWKNNTFRQTLKS